MELLDRVGRVRLLLETMNDYVPTPAGALRSDSGPAASRFVPCATCRRTGWVKARRGLVLCLVCDGVGWKRRGAGEEEWDAYVELPVAQAVELPTMGVANGRHDPDTIEESYSWERARATADRNGSYKQVRVRLDQLGQVHRLRHRLITVVLVDKEPVTVSPWHDTQVSLGVAWIALGLRVVRVPPWIMERSAAAEQRETLGALVADGYSASEIARKTGMSTKAVRRKMGRLSALHSGRAGVPARAT